MKFITLIALIGLAFTSCKNQDAAQSSTKVEEAVTGQGTLSGLADDDWVSITYVSAKKGKFEGKANFFLHVMVTGTKWAIGKDGKSYVEDSFVKKIGTTNNVTIAADKADDFTGHAGESINIPAENINHWLKSYGGARWDYEIMIGLWQDYWTGNKVLAVKDLDKNDLLAILKEKRQTKDLLLKDSETGAEAEIIVSIKKAK